MSYSPHFKKNDWLAICDYCGMKFHASQLKKTWDGYYACKLDWNPRQPQDFLKGIKDDPSVEWERPEQPDVEQSTDGWHTPDSVPDGTFDGSL